jgi:hypothetical protein
MEHGALDQIQEALIRTNSCSGRRRKRSVIREGPLTLTTRLFPVFTLLFPLSDLHPSSSLASPYR